MATSSLVSTVPGTCDTSRRSGRRPMLGKVGSMVTGAGRTRTDDSVAVGVAADGPAMVSDAQARPIPPSAPVTRLVGMFPPQAPRAGSPRQDGRAAVRPG